MQELDFATAQRILTDSLAAADETFHRPVCVAIVDAAGALLAFARQDGAPLRGIRIAEGKAYSAARMGVTTQAFLERLLREQIAVGYFCDDRLTALPGGAPLRNRAGRLLGAIGVSGLTSAEDQVIVNLQAERLAVL